jgi:hypothetical protein
MIGRGKERIEKERRSSQISHFASTLSTSFIESLFLFYVEGRGEEREERKEGERKGDDRKRKRERKDRKGEKVLTNITLCI